MQLNIPSWISNLPSHPVSQAGINIISHGLFFSLALFSKLHAEEFFAATSKIHFPREKKEATPGHQKTVKTNRCA